MPRTFVWHRTRGPKHTEKDAPATKGQLRIKQVRSAIGHSWRYRQVLAALGLRHHQAEIVRQDSPALRGQIRKVRHLVEVTPVKE
jgi:large subunit ribosomal protein L30